MAAIDREYHKLLKLIYDEGVDKGDRTGTGTRSIFEYTLRYNMAKGFPLLTTKKMFTKGIITELLWFLTGNTNIRPLVLQGNNIWVGDAYKKYEKSFDIDPNNFDAEEVSKGHNDQCWGYPTLDYVKPTSKEYKRGQINAYLEGKAEKPYFFLTKKEFIESIKTDDKFAREWGELGPVYGKQWVNWGGYEINSGKEIEGINKGVNQIQNAIDLLKNNPDSRRIMVNAWNVAEIDKMTLPPCHWGFELYTEELTKDERWRLLKTEAGATNIGWDSMSLPTHEWMDEVKTLETYGLDLTLNKGKTIKIPRRKLSLKWHQRSVDTFLGCPFNIASYAFLLEMVAQQVNMIPHMLIGDLSNVHIYQNHIGQVKEQLSRDTSKYNTPKLKLNKATDIFSYNLEDFGVIGYESYEKIVAPLSN